MKLDMTELGPVKRAIKIEVPQDDVNRAFDTVFADLRRQARIPGFRPGKAPIALLEKRYARAVEQDVVQRLVPDYYQRAIKEAGVIPVFVEIPPLDRIKAKRNMSLTFTATVEIKPKIELRDYRPPNPISLKPDARTVTDDQVEQALQKLREQHARIDAAPSGSQLSDGLYAVLNIEGFLDGELVEGTKLEGHMHKVGSKAPILGLEVDDLLIGKVQGETIELPQPYPDNHPDSRMAGKTLIFQIKIEAIKQVHLPVLDDEFAKDCGPYESLDQLRNTVREHLEEMLKKEVEETHKQAIMDRLLETHHFELPEVMVEREIRAMIRQRVLEEQRKKRHGLGIDETIESQEDIKRLQNELVPEAKRRVKIGLIFERIAETEGLTVDNQEMEAELEKLARRLNLSSEEIHRLLDAGGEDSRLELRERLLAEKALQLVYHFAVIQG